MGNKLFVDYLSDRKQKVRLDNVLSEEMIVRTGIPQGTILGPVLFLIYINRFTDSLNVSGLIVSYADDTAMLFLGDSWDEVHRRAESELVLVQRWMNSNLLSLNLKKSSFMTFSLVSQDQPPIPSIIVHDEICDRAHNCTCLYVNR